MVELKRFHFKANVVFEAESRKQALEEIAAHMQTVALEIDTLNPPAHADMTFFDGSFDLHEHDRRDFNILEETKL